MTKGHGKVLWVALVLVASVPAWASKAELWVYTSIYKEFAAPIEKAFEEKHPDIDVQVFQAGSEKIQAKIEAELLAGKPQADILLTSDPFWSAQLEKRGFSHLRPGHSAVERNYYSAMILIAHRDFPKEKRPAGFRDLARPEFKGLIQSGSPLESGTAFSAVGILSKKYGWDYFQNLRDNDLASAGGNAAVIQKIESGERKIGIVLLENALAAKRRGSPIEILYPADGVVLIPSVQVILSSSRQKEAAGRFADFILSRQGQELLRNGYMYSVRKDVAAPEGAPSFAAVSRNSEEWTPALIEEISNSSKEIKRKFAELMLD